MSDERRAPTNEQLQAFLRAGSPPLLYVARDGTVLEANDSGVKSLDRERDQVLGQSLFAMLPSMAASLRAPFERVFESGQPVVVEDDTPRPEGQRRFRSILDPVLDDAGAVLAVRVQSSEVTEEHAVADSLRRADQKLSVILEHSPSLILMLGRDGIVTYINRVGPGFTMADVVGSDGHRFVAPELHAEHDERLRLVFEGGVASKFEFCDIHGTWWETTMVPVSDAGRVEHAVSFSVDITDKRRAQDEQARMQVQMQHAQKLESLGVLAGGIAHDFNNLLLVISANTELALARLGADDEYREHLGDVVHAAGRAAGLCKQLLAYAGRGKLVAERVDLSGVVSEMAQLVAVSVSKGVQLQRDLAIDLPAIEADPTQLRQVVLNLITNASDAIGDQQGTISIRTRCEQLAGEQLHSSYMSEDLEPGAYVTLDVRDTGCGIDEPTRTRMFEPFFSTKGSGRGLGLSATLGIIRRHRGAVFVESTPGAGSSIRVVFPVSSGAARRPASQPAASAPPGHGVVLVIDDEPGVLRVAATALTRDGYEVLTASDGREGLARYDEHRADIRLVLLNLTMPVLDGVQTLRALRERAPTLPIVIMSGYAEATPPDGSARFLAKPFRVDELLAIVGKALADRS